MTDDLYEQALDAIREVFNDKTQSVNETRINLDTLKDEINTLLSTLSKDEPD